MPLIIKYIRDKRFRKIIALFLRFVLQLWWLGKSTRFNSAEKRELKYKAVYRKQARTFTETATELGGLLIKLGQFFSSRVDVLPEEYTSELSKLQDAVKPVATEEIIQCIEAEFGSSINEIFRKFSQFPVAAASLGQVHTAETKEHKKVAVKILRPGIEKIIRVDFEALRFVANFAKRYPKINAAVDLDQIYNEFVETTLDELDYVKEGRNADTFRANFAADERFYVPQIDWEYTTQRVLTMEFIEGCKVNDYEALEKAGIDRALLADTLIAAFVQQVLYDSFFHADPHPGNLLVKEDGRLVFLDFGMMGRIEKRMREELVAFIMAIFKKDTDEMITVFEHLGFLRPHANKSTLSKSFKLILAAMFEAPNLKTINSEEFLLEIREFMYSQPFQIPAQMLFLGKALSTILGICSGLNPKLDLIKTLQPYAEDLLSGAKTGSPKQGSVLDQAKKTLIEVVTLPEKLNRFLTGLELGEVRIQPSRSFESDLLQNQSQQASRIVRAILSSGFLISGSILLGGPFFKSGIAMIILSGLIFLSLMRMKRTDSHFRSRRRMEMREPTGFHKPRFHP
ncbi:ABC1 kinase family protein [Desulfitobacterium sp. Sab5]|uniref:ABC1 kinase family protein n=1 Tax=Desulfitobacterium nosdiversum TaxID=3375356 RepID=UPI003CE77DD0